MYLSFNLQLTYKLIRLECVGKLKDLNFFSAFYSSFSYYEGCTQGWNGNLGKSGITRWSPGEVGWPFSGGGRLINFQINQINYYGMNVRTVNL